MSSIVSNADSCRVTFSIGGNIATTSSQYKACYISGSMTVCLPSDATDDIVGIIDSYQSAGSDYVSVITQGLAKGIMRTGTSCAIGALLSADALGTLDTAITNTTDQNILGRAMTVPATGGSVVVLIDKFATITVP